MSDPYLPPKCDYKVEGNHIRTDGSIKGKITGTMMAGIMNLSPFTSPFQVACRLLGVGEKDIGDKPAVHAGQVLEPVVIEYANKAYPEYGLFLPADEVHEKREGDHASWVSDFPDDYFAGHVDGYVMSDDGENYILEIKTSANMESWEDGVPIYYYWQVALYNHFLTHKDKAYVVLGIMDEKARRFPEKWIPSEENVVMFEMETHDENVENMLCIIREWYDEFIANGITPDFNPEIKGDVELYQHLLNLTEDENTMKEMVDNLADVREKIKIEEAKLQPLYNTEEILKKRLKDYLDCHKLDDLQSTSGSFVAVMNTQKRVKIDPMKLKEAGINPEPFETTSISKTFTIKEVKE